MAKCVVPYCRSNNRELFCSPDDKNKLRKWKEILKVDLNSFLVCDIHFSDKFLKSEKFLTQDAFPSILVEPNDYSNDQNNDYCQSCLKKFEASSTKVSVSENIQKIFVERTAFEIKLHAYLCSECHDKFMDFESFVSAIKAKQELKAKSGDQTVKSEIIEVDVDVDDDNECPQLYPIPTHEIGAYPQFFVENSEPNILREVLGRESIVQQEVPQQQIQQKNPTRILNKNISTQPNANLNEKTQVQIESGKRPSLLYPKLQEYLIPIRNESTEQSNNNIIKPESTNSPMTVIPDYRKLVPVNASLVRKIRSKSIHEKQHKLNNSIQHDHVFAMINSQNMKRRNSVASTIDVPENVNKRMRTQFLPTKLISCNVCPMQFRSIEALQSHQENEHKVPQLKAIEKPENFRCSDCNEGFTSYYYLRKHKDSCNYSLRFKCVQQYCRFRAATAEDINNHMLDAHFSQTACKICKKNFETPELYKIHEREEHKKERARKQKIEFKPGNELKKILLKKNPNNSS